MAIGVTSKWTVLGGAGRTFKIEKVLEDALQLDSGAVVAVDNALLSHVCVGEIREIELCRGDRIQFAVNDKERGIINGQIGLVLKDGLVELESGGVVELGGDFCGFDYGWVSTSHKSQGRTAKNVVVAAEVAGQHSRHRRRQDIDKPQIGGEMKVVVLNNTGNVGKSFIAREVVYANMAEPRKIFDFESYNMPNSVFKAVNSELHSRRTFKEMLMNAAFAGNAVTDVGSSNILEFLEEMRKYSRELFSYDLFIVPSVLDDKQDSDTVKVLHILAAFKLQDKTRVVFNRYQSGIHGIEKSKVWRDGGALGFDISAEVTISESSTVNEITEARLTLDEILCFKTDFKEAAFKEKDKNKQRALYEKYLLQVSAESLRHECVSAWKKISGGPRDGQAS